MLLVALEQAARTLEPVEVLQAFSSLLTLGKLILKTDSPEHAHPVKGRA
jgi:hypothetical protein